jgi:hypothetical protein
MRQVWTAAEVNFGQAEERTFWSWDGDNGTVPPNQTLEVASVLLNYFPSGGGSIGRCEVVGRDVAGSSQWRLDIVYVRPQETTHLTFPMPLRLDAGGHVELGFTSEGPGAVTATINGRLV